MKSIKKTEKIGKYLAKLDQQTTIIPIRSTGPQLVNDFFVFMRVTNCHQRNKFRATLLHHQILNIFGIQVAGLIHFKQVNERRWSSSITPDRHPTVKLRVHLRTVTKK
jgi:hypothetical protein